MTAERLASATIVGFGRSSLVGTAAGQRVSSGCLVGECGTYEEWLSHWQRLSRLAD